MSLKNWANLMHGLIVNDTKSAWGMCHARFVAIKHVFVHVVDSASCIHPALRTARGRVFLFWRYFTVAMSIQPLVIPKIIVANFCNIIVLFSRIYVQSAGNEGAYGRARLLGR